MWDEMTVNMLTYRKKTHVKIHLPPCVAELKRPHLCVRKQQWHFQVLHHFPEQQRTCDDIGELDPSEPASQV